MAGAVLLIVIAWLVWQQRPESVAVRHTEALLKTLTLPAGRGQADVLLRVDRLRGMLASEATVRVAWDGGEYDFSGRAAVQEAFTIYASQAKESTIDAKIGKASRFPGGVLVPASLDVMVNGAGRTESTRLDGRFDWIKTDDGWQLIAADFSAAAD